ncbi:MAG: hypothetical protein JRH20_20245 [Deltaproteobacteria bacterium]|nr:hypothetical protein [Deltaproteobacteria bacterium]
MPRRSLEKLVELFKSKTVVELSEIQTALAGASRTTAFRYLRQVTYRSSYNKNGRYYALHDPAKYDRWGLYSVGDIHFSVDGTLKATVTRLVRKAEAGKTQKEIQELLRVRVQLFLMDALAEGVIARERFGRLYVYLHIDEEVRAAQLRQRREMLDKATGDEEGRDLIVVDDELTIRVLLVLLRYPGAGSSDVVRHLKGRLPPVGRAQVDNVFARYGLGEKKGPLIF